MRPREFDPQKEKTKRQTSLCSPVLVPWPSAARPRRFGFCWVQSLVNTVLSKEKCVKCLSKQNFSTEQMFVRAAAKKQKSLLGMLFAVYLRRWFSPRRQVITVWRTWLAFPGRWEGGGGGGGGPMFCWLWFLLDILLCWDPLGCSCL